MKKLSEKLSENSLEWELVGLLHDLDFDEVRSDMSKHGVVAAEKLKGKLPEHCLYAIKAHDYRTGFKPQSRLDKALIAVDSLAVLMNKAQAEFQEPKPANILNSPPFYITPFPQTTDCTCSHSCLCRLFDAFLPGGT